MAIEDLQSKLRKAYGEVLRVLADELDKKYGTFALSFNSYMDLRVARNSHSNTLDYVDHTQLSPTSDILGTLTVILERNNIE